MSERLLDSAPGEARCANCGRSTGPAFCGHCGQEVDARRGPLLPVVREVLDDWLSLDGRLLKTLAALVRPGLLTREYLAGRRVPFVRPFRLYLLASLALFSSVLALQAPDVSGINLYVAGERISGAEKPTGATLTLYAEKSRVMRWVASRSTEKIDRLKALPPQELVDSVFRNLRRVLPAALVLFVPILALALKLLYWRTRTLYVDHLVFALHFQSALFLLLATAWLVARLLRLPVGLSILLFLVVAFVGVVVYLFRALRRTYGQGAWRTALRTLGLALAYAVLLRYVLGLAIAVVVLAL